MCIVGRKVLKVTPAQLEAGFRQDRHGEPRLISTVRLYSVRAYTGATDTNLRTHRSRVLIASTTVCNDSYPGGLLVKFLVIQPPSSSQLMGRETSS